MTSFNFIKFILVLISLNNSSLNAFLKHIKLKSIKELGEYILENDFSSIYRVQWCNECMYFIFDSTSTKLSFSKLKLIKNYLRNAISQDRLSNIAILNIEKHISHQSIRYQ